MRYISKAFTSKTMSQEKASEPEPERILDDGVYWIRSITKDRYIDFHMYAYASDRDTKLVGQTLSPAAKSQQQASAPPPIKYVDIYIDLYYTCSGLSRRLTTADSTSFPPLLRHANISL
jgi:hypothetical protein